MVTAYEEALALGLWLPCGQANFFHSIRDKVLIPENFGEAPLLTLPKSKTQEEQAHREFQCSTFRRCFEVLGGHGYDVALPLYPRDRIPYIYKSDPDAALFYSKGISDTYLKNLTLIVNAEGFYIWIVPGLDRQYFSTARDHLARHIRSVFGGDYYSRYSGLPEDEQRARSALGDEECSQSVKGYFEDDLGILAFFQLNMVLEGLYNYNLDPFVFFATSSELEVNSRRKNYSVGGFIELVEEEVHGVPSDGVCDLVDPHHLVDGKPIDKIMIRSRGIIEQILSPESKAEVLRKFLRSIANETLQHLKWRIEACRRALLHDMLGVTHRHQPLIQIELPNSDDHETIRNVSESQLRGYVMLAGAKLPLITNIAYHLEDVTERLEEELEDLGKKETYRNMHRFFHSWSSLLKGIETNIRGLERVIEQSTADRMVYEEEQVRAEQEMVGELEVLRERDVGTSSESRDESPGFVEALLAAIAVILSLFSLRPERYWLIPLVIVLSIGIYLTLFYGRKWIKRTLQPYRWAKPLEGNFFYKADLRVELRLSNEGSFSLLSGQLDVEPQSGEGQNDALIWGVLKSLDVPKRSSYRIERISKDTSIQKIHLERLLVWKEHPGHRSRRFLFWGPREDKMLLHLIYEIMFNRLTSPNEFVLRELRTVAINDRPLKPEELVAFRRLIARYFVNPLLADNEECLNLASDALVIVPTK
jgi:hypothetical protein